MGSEWDRAGRTALVFSASRNSGGMNFMNRKELVRRMVLNEISDDYEHVDQIILPNVARECAKLGFVVERSHIVDALREFIEGGLARAYLLSSTEPAKELQGMPSLDVIEEYFKTYFYITPKGMELHLSDDTCWPLDDEGNPRP